MLSQMIGTIATVFLAQVMYDLLEPQRKQVVKKIKEVTNKIKNHAA